VDEQAADITRGRGRQLPAQKQFLPTSGLVRGKTEDEGNDKVA